MQTFNKNLINGNLASLDKFSNKQNGFTKTYVNRLEIVYVLMQLITFKNVLINNTILGFFQTSNRFNLFL